VTAAKSLPWHRREPEAFRRLAHDVDVEFPGLYFEDRGGTLIVAGEFLVSEGGRVLDRYQIEVEVPRDGPATGLPVVREVGGRIPRTPDHHVNPDGSACLAVPDEFWYRNPDGLDLLAFLRGSVLNYFIGQSIVAAGGVWPHGERAHGDAGLLEFYASVVGTNDPARVHAFVTMASAKKVRAHWPCPCGSGRRVLACHGGRVHHLRSRLSRRLLRAAAASIGRLVP
jgi:hypothetical protein